MPWGIIMMPFWAFPVAAWLIILFEIAPKQEVMLTTGACVMVGAPILSLVFFLSFYPRYREAKIRAKKETNIAKREENNETREPDTVPEV